MRDQEPTIITIHGQPVDEKRVTAVYRCHLELEQLEDTDHPNIKHCAQCSRSVVKVEDFDGFMRVVAMNGCAWGPMNDGHTTQRGKSDIFLGELRVTDYTVGCPLRWDE
jgi:hypothetical protein